MRTSNDGFPARLVMFGAIVAIVATMLEVLKPVFSVGPVGFTTSEIAVGFFIATAAVWGLQAGMRIFRLKPLDLAVILFLVSNYLSSALSEDRPSAFKFSLRLTYGTLVYFGITRLPRRYRAHLVVAGAIAATVVLVSLVGVLENFCLTCMKALLSPFKERIITFGAYYNVRISSTFPFPTIFAFYLEMLIPVLLAFGLWLAGTAKELKRRRLLMVLTLVCTFIPLAAIAFTYTRSAYVVAPATLLVGAVLAAIFGYGRRVYLSFAVAAVFFVSLVGVSAIFSNTMAFRLGLAEQEQRFSAEYTLTGITPEFKPGEKIWTRIHVSNRGTVKWAGPGDEPALVVYRWLSYPEMVNQDVELIVTDVPRDIYPGDEADIDVEVMTPSTPGKYILVYELFIDAPFSHTGVSPLVVPVDLEESGSSQFVIPESPSSFYDRDPAPMSIPRRELWSAAVNAWKANPILGLGPDQFRKRYVEFLPGVELDPRLGAHNIFLDAMANTGIIGLAALVYLLASAVWLLVNTARDRSAAGDVRLISLGLLVSMIAYIGHGMFEYPLWQTGMMMMWFILLGLVSLLTGETGRRQP